MKDFKKIIPYLIVLIISCNKKSEIHINISTTTEINKEMNIKMVSILRQKKI